MEPTLGTGGRRSEDR